MTQRHLHPYSVVCPLCDAQPGEDCRTIPTGPSTTPGTARSPHRRRFAAATNGVEKMLKEARRAGLERVLRRALYVVAMHTGNGADPRILDWTDTPLMPNGDVKWDELREELQRELDLHLAAGDDR